MVKCTICKRELNNHEKYSDYYEFNRADNNFIICKEDLKIIMVKIKQMAFEPQPYKEHAEWHLKEKKLLKVAKDIYTNCKNNHEKINFKKERANIYDLMCEDCWNSFKREERKLK